MTNLNEALTEAAVQGIVSGEQAGRLRHLFVARGLLPAEGAVMPPQEGSGLFASLDAPVDEGDVVDERSEAPRFVRGFHDVLITIGIVAALSGLGTLTSVYLGWFGAFAVLIACVALAELLVKRQRLALPAFTLTVFWCATIITAALPPIENLIGDNHSLAGLLLFIGTPLLIAPWYWRYRVPVAAAAMLFAVAGFVFFALATLFSLVMPGDDLFDNRPRLVMAVGLVTALLLFAVAMRFDLADRQRVTRRSDVAFWLHLATAPLLLFFSFGTLLGEEGGFWWTQQPGLNEALLAVVLVTVMMLIGIAIDRRAFVTAGLISLGAAIYTLIAQAGMEFSSLFAMAVLLVGIIVLVLGIGWQQLRRVILGLLPQGMRDVLPV